MVGPILSPDGKSMWNGSEWIPASPAPSNQSANVSLQDSVIGGDVNITQNNAEDIATAMVSALEKMGFSGQSSPAELTPSQEAEVEQVLEMSEQLASHGIEIEPWTETTRGIETGEAAYLVAQNALRLAGRTNQQTKANQQIKALNQKIKAGEKENKNREKELLNLDERIVELESQPVRWHSWLVLAILPIIGIILGLLESLEIISVTTLEKPRTIVQIWVSWFVIWIIIVITWAYNVDLHFHIHSKYLDQRELIKGTNSDILWWTDEWGELVNQKGFKESKESKEERESRIKEYEEHVNSIGKNLLNLNERIKESRRWSFLWSSMERFDGWLVFVIFPVIGIILPLLESLEIISFFTLYDPLTFVQIWMNWLVIWFLLWIIILIIWVFITPPNPIQLLELEISENNEKLKFVKEKLQNLRQS